MKLNVNFREEMKKWLSWYSNNRLLMYIVEGTCRFHNIPVSKQTP